MKALRHAARWQNGFTAIKSFRETFGSSDDEVSVYPALSCSSKRVISGRHLVLFQEEVFPGFLIQEILREYHRMNRMLRRGDDGQGEKDPVIKQEQRDEGGEE